MTKATTKTTGAIWNQFYKDTEAWPEDSYHDDLLLKINGKTAREDVDPGKLPADAEIQIESGYVVFPDGSDSDLAEHFEKWLAKQAGLNIVFGSFRVSQSKLAAVRQAIIDSGGELLE